jgi:hypothetical protein
MKDAELSPEVWPPLPLEAWADTYATLHMWLQIVGKIRLRYSPWLNHSWHATFYVTARGLTTSPIPYREDRVFEVEFDFIGHRLAIRAADGQQAEITLEAQTVASFHQRLMNALDSLDLPVKIHPKPNEIVEPLPFDQDETHRSYDPEWVNRFWRILVQADRVFSEFRSRFIGKCSPVHLFWGAADLAVTRFSGRPAPEHPGGIPNLPDWITREAYSHEVISCGFWPGGGPVPHAAFYSYAYPEPPGFRASKVVPSSASYNMDLREFILPYEAVREAASPRETLLAFLQSVYESAANLGGWERPELEAQSGPATRPRMRSSH